MLKSFFSNVVMHFQIVYLYAGNVSMCYSLEEMTGGSV